MRLSKLFLLVVLAASPVLAQNRELTPFAGWQEGGALTVNNDEGDLDGGPTFGVMLSFERALNTRLDVVLSHQESEVATGDFFDELRVDDATVDYLHVGGRYLFSPGERVNPYIAATLGGTRVAVAGEDSIGFSFAGGVGADIELSRSLALRLDGRYYITLSGSRTAFACGDNECNVDNDGQTFTQAAATAGLVFKF